MKLDDLRDLFLVFVMRRRFFDTFRQSAFRREQHAVSAAQSAHVFAAKAAPFQTDHIQPRQMGAFAFDQAKRNDVFSTPDMPPIMAKGPMRTN